VSFEPALAKYDPISGSSGACSSALVLNPGTDLDILSSPLETEPLERRLPPCSSSSGTSARSPPKSPLKGADNGQASSPGVVTA
jgi:hypothetical protein